MTVKYCKRCEAYLDVSEFRLENRNGTLRYNSYCMDHEREYRREAYRKKHNLDPQRYYKDRERELSPKLDAETLALVSSDPIWETWLACPPRTELDLQHSLAVELHRKYRCDYAALSHTMRDVWITHWTKKLGHAPYAGKVG